MKRNAFSPFDEGVASGISHAPAIDGAFTAAAFAAAAAS